MAKTTERLIQDFRNIIVGDFDVPKDDPDIDITDDEVLSYLNIAQDHLSRLAKLQAVNIAFTCTGGQQFSLDDPAYFGGVRFDEVQSLYIGNSKQKLFPLDDWNANATSGVFIGGDAIIVMGTGTITGYVCGNILARTLVAAATTQLPIAISDFHLARYTAALFASSLSMDTQTQMAKIKTFTDMAEHAARQYSSKQRQTRFPNTTRRQAYRV